MSLDPERVSTLIKDAAARLVMPRFDRLDSSEIREKGPGDLVTVADEETEAFLSAAFRDLLPGSIVIGEEAAAARPELLTRAGESGDIWIVDPVDGTANFAAGIPIFAVMVALVQAHEIRASWIYDPVKDRMAVATAGGGAWCNGARLAVAGPTTPDQMSGSVAMRLGNRHLMRRIAGRSDLVGSVFSLRCAGLEYLALAQGRAHFALYHRLMPWDHAPGYLLHREAGGFARRLDRSAYTPVTRDGGLLITPDEASWEALHAVLIGGKA